MRSVMCDSVCYECANNRCEEITDGYYGEYCKEDSDNYMTEDGCCYFQRRQVHEEDE